MSRKKIIYTDEFPYHITARTNNKEDFPCALEIVWRIMCEQLAFVQHKEQLEIHAFVLMKNHFHLLASTPNANISKIMYWFMKHTTYEIQKASNRINRIFGGRYKASLISNFRYYQSALAYIYQNPLRAGLEAEIGNYPFSTYTKTKDSIRLPFSIISTNMFSSTNTAFENRGEWTKNYFNENETAAIKLGLSRKVFKDPSFVLGSSCRTQNHTTFLDQLLPT